MLLKKAFIRLHFFLREREKKKKTKNSKQELEKSRHTNKRILQGYGLVDKQLQGGGRVVRHVWTWCPGEDLFVKQAERKRGRAETSRELSSSVPVGRNLSRASKFCCSNNSSTLFILVKPLCLSQTLHLFFFSPSFSSVTCIHTSMNLYVGVCVSIYIYAKYTAQKALDIDNILIIISFGLFD